MGQSKTPVHDDNGISVTANSSATEKDEAPAVSRKHHFTQKVKEGLGLAPKTRDDDFIFAKQRHHDHMHRVEKLADAFDELEASTRSQLHHEDMVIARLESLAADSPLFEMVKQISTDHNLRKEETLKVLQTRGKAISDLTQSWQDTLKKTHKDLKKEHEAARMDYDHYSVKVEGLRKKSSDDHPNPKLEGNEEKYTAARSIYGDTTDSAIRVYDTMYSDGWNDLAPILDTYLDLEVDLANIQAEHKAKVSKSKKEKVPPLSSLATRIPYAKTNVDKKVDNNTVTSTTAY